MKSCESESGSETNIRSKDMIDYETTGRIYSEVLRGITESPADTSEEREYRTRLASQVAEIQAKGGVPIPRDDLP